MKLKLFTVDSGNWKPGFDDLEASADEWLVYRPCIVVENTHTIARPNVGLNSHNRQVP